jgi:hypothetical protein
LGAGQGGFRSTAVAVIAYAVAMGWLEAAVVVYLRTALGILPATIPAHDPDAFGTFAGVEAARELATLVMIGAVGWLAGRASLERLAWASVVFGVWDIVYYAGLRLAVDWPPSIDTWDVLFLVPVPWVGPVWAPVAVSVALVTFGLAAARRLREGRPVRLGWPHVIASAAGGLLVIVSFLLDTDRVLAGDASPWSGWPVFATGMTLAAVAAALALRAPSASDG